MTWAGAVLVALSAPRLRPVCSVLAIFVPGVGRCRDEHAGTDTIRAMRPTDIDRWRVIVPVKGPLTAKSRLHPPTGVTRPDLAHAFALDTITAAVTALPPGQLVVVTSDEHTSTFVRDRGGICLLYTSDAADEEDSVDLGG